MKGYNQRFISHSNPNNDLMTIITTSMTRTLRFQSINAFRVSAGLRWRVGKVVEPARDDVRKGRFSPGKYLCTPPLHFSHQKLQFRPMWKILCLKYHHPLYLNTRTEDTSKAHTKNRRIHSKLVRVCNHIILFIARHHQHLHSWTRREKL
jgi:hypothetical protein